MSPAEQKLRAAQQTWEAAMQDWAEAQKRIHAAKAAWSAAQVEFFTGGSGANQRSWSMITFEPTETPLGVPVLTSFIVRDRAYIVDINGMLLCIHIDGDDPELWYWHVVQEL